MERIQSSEERRIEIELILKELQNAHRPEPALKETMPGGFCNECGRHGVFQMARICLKCGKCMEHCQCDKEN